MNGTYISAKTEADFFGSVWMDRILIEADGAGSAQWQSLLADDNGTFVYDVAANGALGVDGEERGIVSRNGNCFALVETDFFDGRSMEFNLRTSSGLSTAALFGDYVTGQLTLDGADLTSRLILVSADGQGLLEVGNFNGNGSSEWQYTVRDDGTLSTREDEDDSYSQNGLVGLNGNVFLSVANTVDTDDAGDYVLRVGIRRSSGMNTTVLSGTYMVCMIAPFGGTVSTARYSMVFDGAGGLTSEVIESSHIPSDGGSEYSVSPDGTLYIDGDQAGIVSADGELFMRANGAFMVGIRQAP